MTHAGSSQATGSLASNPIPGPTPRSPATPAPTPDQLQARIAAGERVSTRAEMSQEYFDDLVNLMTMQADSELAGGFGYVPWIQRAPGVEEKLIVANIVRDETRHAKAVYGLLRDLGIDVDSRVEQHDFNYRIAQENIGTDRVGTDARVNIFYYPIETWADFVTFNFLMDRGAGHQLEDGLVCSYVPWANELQRIFKEELTHIRHGDMWVERLAKDPATHDEIQAAVTKWFPRVMNIFGRPGTRRNERYRYYGLKKRDNDEVRAAFVAEVKANCDAWGLTLPDWTPDWQQADTQERFGA
ncbi:MAG TPA: Phenylacetic acid catabolic protein [Candidatus Saccharimonadales bacterium]|nr:Phenylacetic acid catabolic protein [Candidatus Saccharimonadales bacterium]